MAWLFLILLATLAVLMFIIMRMSTYAAEGSKYMENMMDALNADIQPFTGDIEPYLIRTHYHLVEKQPLQNLDEVDRELSKQPHSADLLVNRAVLNLKHRAHDDAIENATTALNVDPQLSDAYYCQGLAYAHKGDNHQAVLDLTEAIELNPHNANLRAARALSFYEEGEYDLALNDCDEAFANQHPHHGALVVRALCLAEKEELQQALMDCRQALRFGPPTARLLTARSRVMHYSHENPVAIIDADAAVEADPELPDAYVIRAKINTALGKHDQAIEDARRGQRLAPNLPMTKEALARVLAISPDPTIRDGGRAVSLAKSANEQTGNKRPMFLDTLAAAYAEIGDFEQAIHWQATALESGRFPHWARNQAHERLKLYQNQKPCRA